jgi:hypothetical protein
MGGHGWTLSMCAPPPWRLEGDNHKLLVLGAQPEELGACPSLHCGCAHVACNSAVCRLNGRGVAPVTPRLD